MSLNADEIRPDRVAVYIRWSTEDQGEGTTLDIQRDACSAYIQSQGWKLRTDLVFVDDGISGAALERPALGRLRALIRQRLVDCVVVYKLDRLSRSVLDMLKLVLEEWDGLCAIKSAREPIDTLSPTGKMFFYQLMSFAEWERNVIRDRMFAGKLRRAQEGRSPGLNLPYGYRRGEGGAIEADPSAAPVVARIYKLYLMGLGARAISRLLHEEGYRSPGGGTWSEGSLLRILSNPAYMGRFVYGKEKKVRGRRVRAKEPLVVRDGFYPAIISAVDFEAAQEARRGRPGPGRSANRAEAPSGKESGDQVGGRSGSQSRSLGSGHLLTGLLRCSCGRSLTGIRLNAGGNTYRYYVCGGVQATGSHVCGAGNIRQELLDDLVVEKLLSGFRSTGARERLVAQVQRELQSGSERAARERLEAEQEVRRLEESEKRLKGLLIDGKLSAEEYREVQTELAGRLQQARQAHQETVCSEARTRDVLLRDHHRVMVMERVGEWDSLSRREQKYLLRQFVSAIFAYRSRESPEISCEVRWRWTPGESGSEDRNVIRQDRSSDSLKRFARSRERVAGRFAPVGRSLAVRPDS